MKLKNYSNENFKSSLPQFPEEDKKQKISKATLDYLSILNVSPPDALFIPKRAKFWFLAKRKLPQLSDHKRPHIIILGRL